mmetsp:Transcript_1062/g.4037  ORF Transcript_1062/g.4037 Transcript_1062/m.4037 type:complete len:261 (+) Transcript_1062:93-875(+)
MRSRCDPSSSPRFHRQDGGGAYGGSSDRARHQSRPKSSRSVSYHHPSFLVKAKSRDKGCGRDRTYRPKSKTKRVTTPLERAIPPLVVDHSHTIISACPPTWASSRVLLLSPSTPEILDTSLNFLPRASGTLLRHHVKIWPSLLEPANLLLALVPSARLTATTTAPGSPAGGSSSHSSSSSSSSSSSHSSSSRPWPWASGCPSTGGASMKGRRASRRVWGSRNCPSLAKTLVPVRGSTTATQGSAPTPYQSENFLPGSVVS